MWVAVVIILDTLVPLMDHSMLGIPHPPYNQIQQPSLRVVAISSFGQNLGIGLDSHTLSSKLGAVSSLALLPRRVY
jgi:hypothetical protein